MDRQPEPSGHQARSVHQWQPFLGFDRERVDPAGTQRLLGGQALLLVERLAVSGEHVPDCRVCPVIVAVTAAAEYGMDAGVQTRQQSLDDDRSHAGVAGREDGCPGEHGCPHLLDRERVADRRVRVEQVPLEFALVVGIDCHVVQVAEAGVDPVHRPVVRLDDTIDNGAALGHRLACLLAENDAFPVSDHRHQVLDSQVATQGDGHRRPLRTVARCIPRQYTASGLNRSTDPVPTARAIAFCRGRQ